MIVLRDGLKYEGTPEALFEVLYPNTNSYNAFTHYSSESKGVISLQSMNMFHLMNATKVAVRRHLVDANGIQSITGIRHWTQKFINPDNVNPQAKLPQFFGFLNTVDNHIAGRSKLAMSIKLNGLTVEGSAIDVFPLFVKVTGYSHSDVNEFAEFDGVSFTNTGMIAQAFQRYINYLNVTVNTQLNSLEDFHNFLSQIYDYEVVAGTRPVLGGLLHEIQRRVELQKKAPAAIRTVIARNLPRYYNSSSRGRILISNMTFPHLMNAIWKILESDYPWMSLGETKNASSLRKVLVDLDFDVLVTYNKELAALIAEFNRNRA